MDTTNVYRTYITIWSCYFFIIYIYIIRLRTCIVFYAPYTVTGSKRKQIVFSRTTFPSGATAAAAATGRERGPTRRGFQVWELDYIGSERVSRRVECQLREQESPTRDPKRPHYSLFSAFFSSRFILRSNHIPGKREPRGLSTTSSIFIARSLLNIYIHTSKQKA